MDGARRFRSDGWSVVTDEPGRVCRAFISYAHGDPVHEEVVRNLYHFLRSCGIDARVDLIAAQQRQDWSQWMADQVRAADVVLVIASRTYRERAEGRGDPAVGKGVRWEARLVRDAFYSDQNALNRFIPVVLPGQGVDGVPDFLAPSTSTVYTVTEFTVAGAEELIRLLTGQPAEVEPTLGRVPLLEPRAAGPDAETVAAGDSGRSPGQPPVVNQITAPSSGPVVQAGMIGSVTINRTPGTALARGRVYLAGSLHEDRLFGHTHELIGRHSELAWLRAQVDDPAVEIVVVPARGGAGKTRLLLELDDRLTEAGILVWWLSPGTPFTSSVLAELSDGAAVLVVEDAHRRSDIEQLARLVAGRPGVTVVAASRPEGVGAISAAMTLSGHDDGSMRVAEPLATLTPADAESLAAVAAGRMDDDVRALAHIAADFPLLITVGGHLLRRGSSPAWALPRDPQYRRQIVDRWQDEAIAPIGGSVDPDVTLRTLASVAALTAYNESDAATQERLADFLGIDTGQLVVLLGKLEAAEVIERRDPWLRVVPDVLASEFLRRQAFTETGRSTGFLDRLVQAMPHQVTTILRNAGEMELFLRPGDPNYHSPLQEIWRDVHRQVLAGDAADRVRWVRDLVEVALYQPEPVLRLAQALVDEPVSAGIGEYGRTVDQRDVLDELGALLRPVGQHSAHTQAVCRLLWRIGKDDTRDRHSTADHPLRVLTDIVSYLPGKSITLAQLVLETVVALLQDGETAGAASVTPLELLIPIAAKDGTTLRSDDTVLTIVPFRLFPEGIQALREQARDLALDYVASQDLALARDAIMVLEAMLHDHSGAAGREITEEERQLWRPEQISVLGALRTFVDSVQVDPAVALRIRRAVGWHARYGDASLRPRAAQLWRDLTDSYDLDRETAMSGNGVFDDDLDVDDHDFAERDRRQAARQDRLAESLLTMTAADVLAELERMSDTLAAAGNPVEDLAAIVGRVCERDTDIGAAVGELLLSSPKPGASRWLAVVLATLASAAPQRAVMLAEGLFGSGQHQHMVALANAFGFSQWDWDDAGLREVFDRLLWHADPVVRASAMFRLRRLKQTHPDEALALALAVNDADPRVAAAVAGVLVTSPVGDPVLARDEDVDRLLEVWEPVAVLDDVPVPQLLGQLCRTHPGRVAGFFLRRMARAAGQEWGHLRFQAIPVSFEPRRPAAEPDRWADALRLIRDDTDEAVRPDDRARVFAVIAGGLDEPALSVLREAFAQPAKNSLLRVAELLAGGKQTFVVDHPSFVAAFLDAAAAVGDAVVGQVHALMLDGPGRLVSILGPGAPAQLRDRARPIAESMPTGRVRSFYVDVANQADAKVRSEQQLQQFLRVQRPWQ